MAGLFRIWASVAAKISQLAAAADESRDLSEIPGLLGKGQMVRSAGPLSADVARPHSDPFVARKSLLGSPSAGTRTDGSKGMFADEAVRRMQRIFFSPPPPQLTWQRRSLLKERKRMWQCGSLISALFLLPWHGWLAACRIVTVHRSPRWDFPSCTNRLTAPLWCCSLIYGPPWLFSGCWYSVSDKGCQHNTAELLKAQPVSELSTYTRCEETSERLQSSVARRTLNEEKFDV